MSKHTKLLAALAFAPLTFAAGLAHAGSYDGYTCGADLNAVEAAIAAGDFLTNKAESNRTNLQTKLAGAAAKVVQKKYGDAIVTLEAISDQATTYANAAKPKLTDATGINEAAFGAVGCLTPYLPPAE